MKVNLADLPKEHPLRNLPLGEIGAEVCNKQQKRWRGVKDWKIGKNVYNDLNAGWRLANEFRCEVENGDEKDQGQETGK